MTDSVKCIRCGREAMAIAGTPHPGELGREIAEKICADCWAEWRNAEVIVINELRLNFMDPRSQDILDQHMREFLTLSDGTSKPAE